jgi:hypothetical protein
VTQISDIHAALVSVITAELPSYFGIPNPYDVESNANLFLQKGYGIGFGPAVNTNRKVCGKVSIERSFSIVLTNQLTASITDFSGVSDVSKQLFEDQFKLIKAIETNVNLSGSAAKALWASDGGLEFVIAGEAKYFLIESQWDVEYFESL